MIKTYTTQQSLEWDEAVRKLSDYDVFYLNAYMRAFELEGYGKAVLAVYENVSDYAVNAIFIRDVADDRCFERKIEKGQYIDISSPYGYGGFMGIVSDWDKLENEWRQWCNEQKIICEFLRFNLFAGYRNHFKGKVESHTHNVVRNLDISIDDLWMNFKQKVRKNVKRATKHGLKVITDPTGKYMNDFLRIYYSTMKRTYAKDSFFFKRDFFETLNNMKENICYFHTIYHDEDGNDKIISTELVLYGSENAYSYLGGTDKDYFDIRPNEILKFEIIKWAKKRGLKNFVLGGGYGSDDGIFEYKKSLAPDGIVDFYLGKCVFDEESYNLLCQLKKTEDSDYFPAYRTSGTLND